MTRVMRFVAAGKADKPYSGQPAGVVAIWNAGADGSDNAPLLDPRANLSKLWLHSDLDYLRIARQVSSRDSGMSAVTVPATVNTSPLNAEYELFTHGLGYSPLISGDIEVSAYVQPAAGSPVPIPGGATNSGGYRWLGFTSDATKVYMHARGFVCPAMTVHWKVRLYDETFQTISEPASMFYAAPHEARFAALGKVSGDRRFVRKVPSGSGQFRLLGQQTLKLVASAGNPPNIHFSDGALDVYQFAFGDGKIQGGGSLHAAGYECEITGGTPRGDGFTYDASGIEIADGSDVVFTTAKAMEVSLGQIKGTLNIPSVSGADSYGAGSHVVDYDIAAVPAGTTFIRGFGQYANATDFLPASRNFDFSGTVILQGASITRAGGGNILVGERYISPIITGGRFKIRDEYFALSANPHVDLGAVTLNYDIRTATFVGGI